VTWIGFGLKHQGGVPAQLTICAAVLAALATSGTANKTGTAIARASKNRLIG
jgi:hypothetical protein